MSEPPAGYRARAATFEDIDAVAELRRAADLVDAGIDLPIRDQIAEWFSMPVVDLERDIVIVEDAAGRSAAVGSLFSLNPELTVESYVVVHPEHRRRGLGSWLLDTLEARARSRDVVAPRLSTEAPSGDTDARALIESRGFAYVRTFWHMVRELGPADVQEVPSPEGVEIRAFDGDRDMRPLFDALELAFADHWNAQPFPYELHEYELDRREPGLVLVADAGGEIVGGTINDLSETTGTVSVLGVVRAWRHRGVATTLLRRSFSALAERGATRAVLSVDAENPTGATRLYESVGMRVLRSFEVFEKRFDGG